MNFISISIAPDTESSYETIVVLREDNRCFISVRPNNKPAYPWEEIALPSIKDFPPHSVELAPISPPSNVDFQGKPV